MAASNLATVPAATPEPDFHYTCANNVDIAVFGNQLVIRVDLSKTRGRSASGKTLTIGTTNGFFQLPTHPGIVMALNVNKK
jgi:hypothetical protein